MFLFFGKGVWRPFSRTRIPRRLPYQISEGASAPQPPLWIRLWSISLCCTWLSNARYHRSRGRSVLSFRRVMPVVSIHRFPFRQSPQLISAGVCQLCLSVLRGSARELLPNSTHDMSDRELCIVSAAYMIDSVYANIALDRWCSAAAAMFHFSTLQNEKISEKAELEARDNKKSTLHQSGSVDIQGVPKSKSLQNRE